MATFDIGKVQKSNKPTSYSIAQGKNPPLTSITTEQSGFAIGSLINVHEQRPHISKEHSIQFLLKDREDSES